jgi:hypothetical protein
LLFPLLNSPPNLFSTLQQRRHLYHVIQLLKETIPVVFHCKFSIINFLFMV